MSNTQPLSQTHLELYWTDYVESVSLVSWLFWFQVLTALKLHIVEFPAMVTWSLVSGYQSFERTVSKKNNCNVTKKAVISPSQWTLCSKQHAVMTHKTSTWMCPLLHYVTYNVYLTMSLTLRLLMSYIYIYIYICIWH